MGRPFADFIAARVALMKLFRVFVASLTDSETTETEMYDPVATAPYLGTQDTVASLGERPG